MGPYCAGRIARITREVDSMFRDLIGVATAIVVVAGISAAIVRGRETATIIGQIGDSFAAVVRTATLQDQSVNGA